MFGEIFQTEIISSHELNVIGEMLCEFLFWVRNITEEWVNEIDRVLLLEGEGEVRPRCIVRRDSSNFDRYFVRFIVDWVDFSDVVKELILFDEDHVIVIERWVKDEFEMIQMMFFIVIPEQHLVYRLLDDE